MLQRQREGIAQAGYKGRVPIAQRQAIEKPG
jgi:hypothetical protein